MGITSNDIAARRAMLERGEEIRKAAKQAEERERLRDTFAAAALTGLLVNGPFNTDAVPRLAYSMANAMLRERNGAAEGRETVCPHVRGTVTQHCSLNFTLTDEERVAIEDAIETVSEALDLMDGEDCLTTATLRSLLERLHT
jgi:hypothetical protein